MRMSWLKFAEKYETADQKAPSLKVKAYRKAKELGFNTSTGVTAKMEVELCEALDLEYQEDEPEEPTVYAEIEVVQEYESEVPRYLATFQPKAIQSKGDIYEIETIEAQERTSNAFKELLESYYVKGQEARQEVDAKVETVKAALEEAAIAGLVKND